MNRRNFFGALFGLVAAPNAIAKVISEYKPVAKKPLLKCTYTIPDWKVTAANNCASYFSPAVYAPYIPLMVTEIHQEIDREMIKKLVSYKPNND
jgi:hypothetical protein